MNILETYYTYSKLAQAAYIDLSKASTPKDGKTIVKTASNPDPGPQRMPNALADEMFTGPDAWLMLSPYFKTSPTTGHSDPAGGFAGMLLSHSTYGKVLAIAGTEPGKDWQTYYDLFLADIVGIGVLGTAIEQGVSVFNYVQALQAAEGAKNVKQLTLRTMLSRNNRGQTTISIHP